MSVASSNPVTDSNPAKVGVISTADAVPVSAIDGLRAGRETDPNAGPGQACGYTVGDRVVFQADGIAGSGVIDDVMPDGSVVWVWPDDAMGRKMLFAADALSVRHEDASHGRQIRSK